MNSDVIFCGYAEPYQLPKQRPQRWRSRHEAMERRLWRERNQAVIQSLSQMVGARPEDIDDFLYELTLKKYSSLLNPRECGWGACRVPLCYPNVCDRYMGIFNRHGNLRDPTHPKCLPRLLQLLQDFLNDASHDDCPDLPIYAEFPGGRRRNCHRFQKGLPNHEPELECNDAHRSDTFFWSLKGPPPSKPEFKREAPVVRKELEDGSPRMSIAYYSGDQPQRMKIRNTFGRQSVFLNDELALAHDKPVGYMEDLLNQVLEQRHSITRHVGRIGNLRSERMVVLIKTIIEKKTGKVDPEKLKTALEQFDFDSLEEKIQQKRTAEEISKLYCSIVQRKSMTSVSQYLLRHRQKHPKKSLGQQQPIADNRRTQQKNEDQGRRRLSTRWITKTTLNEYIKIPN